MLSFWHSFWARATHGVGPWSPPKFSQHTGFFKLVATAAFFTGLTLFRTSNPAQPKFIANSGRGRRNEGRSTNKSHTPFLFDPLIRSDSRTVCVHDSSAKIKGRIKVIRKMHFKAPSLPFPFPLSTLSRNVGRTISQTPPPHTRKDRKVCRHIARNRYHLIDICPRTSALYTLHINIRIRTYVRMDLYVYTYGSVCIHVCMVCVFVINVFGEKIVWRVFVVAVCEGTKTCQSTHWLHSEHFNAYAVQQRLIIHCGIEVTPHLLEENSFRLKPFCVTVRYVPGVDFFLFVVNEINHLALFPRKFSFPMDFVIFLHSSQ